MLYLPSLWFHQVTQGLVDLANKMRLALPLCDTATAQGRVLLSLRVISPTPTGRAAARGPAQQQRQPRRFGPRR
jgi:hypothetical protein